MIHTLAVGFALPVALLLAAPAAQVQIESPHYLADECVLDPRNTSDAKLLACVQRLYRIEDARINREYKAEMRALKTPEEKAALRAKARHWISERDRVCLTPRYEGEVTSKVDLLICMLDLTAER